MLGGVEERGDKGNEKGGEVLPNDLICGGGDSYRLELVRGGNREGLGDQGGVRGREGGGERGGGGGGGGRVRWGARGGRGRGRVRMEGGEEGGPMGEED